MRNLVELPTIELEDRFYNLTESATTIKHGEERRRLIAQEIAHVVFELDCRTMSEAPIISAQPVVL
jgi:hypothetical protein